jgi:hypothetical protein
VDLRLHTIVWGFVFFMIALLTYDFFAVRASLPEIEDGEFVYGVRAGSAWRAYPERDLEADPDGILLDTYYGFIVAVRRTSDGVVSATRADTGEALMIERTTWKDWRTSHRRTTVFGV